LAVRDYFDEGDYADCEYVPSDTDNPWIPPDDPEVQECLEEDDDNEY